VFRVILLDIDYTHRQYCLTFQ